MVLAEETGELLGTPLVGVPLTLMLWVREQVAVAVGECDALVLGVIVVMGLEERVAVDAGDALAPALALA